MTLVNHAGMMHCFRATNVDTQSTLEITSSCTLWAMATHINNSTLVEMSDFIYIHCSCVAVFD